MATLAKILAAILWIAQRFFKRRDENEPQRNVDKARQDAANGDDSELNKDLDMAKDGNDNRR